jgi:NADH dehydrogenase
VERGEQVRVVTRGTRPAEQLAVPGVETIVGDIRDRAVVDRAVAGARTVISAIQGFGGDGALGVQAIDRDANAGLIRAAVAAGVDHFVLLSIHGASADHPIELFRMKAAAEGRLKASGLSWTIVRPTAYQELWLEIIGRPLLDTGRTRVFGRGRNPINFVASGDVARVIEQATIDPGLRGATIDVAGPENLSFDEVVEVVRDVTGVEGSVNHVPPVMLRVMSAVLRPIKPVLAGQIAAAIVMGSRDMTADSTERVRRFPSIPATRLTDVALRQLVDGAGETRAVTAPMTSR